MGASPSREATPTDQAHHRSATKSGEYEATRLKDPSRVVADAAAAAATAAATAEAADDSTNRNDRISNTNDDGDGDDSSISSDIQIVETNPHQQHHDDANDEDEDDGIMLVVPATAAPSGDLAEIVVGRPCPPPGDSMTVWGSDDDDESDVEEQEADYDCQSGGAVMGGQFVANGENEDDDASSWDVDSQYSRTWTEDEHEEQGPHDPRFSICHDIGDAVDALESYPGVTEFLSLQLGRCVERKEKEENDDDEEDFEEEDDEEAAEYGRSFHEFVTLLGEPNNQSIREFIFERCRFDESDGLDAEDLERFFGDVLPNYRTLKRLSFNEGAVDSSLLRLLAQTLPAKTTATTTTVTHTATATITTTVTTTTTTTTTTSKTTRPPRVVGTSPLWKLSMYRCNLDPDCVRIVAHDVIRRNTLLRAISLDLTHFNSAASRLVCRSVRHNTNLRTLHLIVDEIGEDTLDKVAHPDSPIRYLSVTGRWTHEGIASFATQLRTNTELLVVSLKGPVVQAGPSSDNDDDDEEDDDDDDDDETEPMWHLRDALRRYNCTIQKFEFVEERSRPVPVKAPKTKARKGGRTNTPAAGPVLVELVSVRWRGFDKFLRRNGRIRKALQEWEEPDCNYCVTPVSLCPAAFELVSDLPTLLYRLLRRGNLKPLCQALAEGHRPNKKKRARGGRR